MELKIDEGLQLGPSIKITVRRIKTKANKVVVGIEAPNDIQIEWIDIRQKRLEQ